MYSNYLRGYLTTLVFLITTRPGTDTYNMSWEAPVKGIAITSYNTLYVAGCDFDVTFFEYGTGDMVGFCTSRCSGKKAPIGLPCNGIGSQGTCQAFGQNLSALILLEHNQIGCALASWLSCHLIKAIFSSWTDASNSYDAMLSATIMDQPSCESAQMSNASYACSNGSSCQNSSSGGGYRCYCSSSSYRQGNPYILDGCMEDYNPKPKEHCPTPASCGPITVPFPFGLEEGCFAAERFRLNCTSGNLTVIVTLYGQYHVTGVSVEDGTLTASTMVNGSNAKEVFLIQFDNGDTVVQPMDDLLDFSMEYDTVIKWAVANLTCQTAMQKKTSYACRSSHSNCLNVTHGKIFMGYRCKCSSGFQGNPYVKDGCIGPILLITLYCALMLLSQLKIFRK